MHGFFSWVTLSFLCVETKRTKKLLCVFLSLCFSFFNPILFSYVIYACLHTVSIYSFFFFCHCNLYQQSRCLNNANPFFIQSLVQFSTLTTIVYCHRGIHGNLGDKAQTHSVWWWSQTRIQRAIIQQSHTPRCTIILQQWHALKDSRRWEAYLSCAHCTLVFTETLCLFCSDYVAFFFLD